MSEVCRRGYKCMCFQCGEKDCEKYQPEPTEWIKKLRKGDQLMDKLIDELKRKEGADG